MIPCFLMLQSQGYESMVHIHLLIILPLSFTTIMEEGGMSWVHPCFYFLLDSPGTPTRFLSCQGWNRDTWRIVSESGYGPEKWRQSWLQSLHRGSIVSLTPGNRCLPGNLPSGSASPWNSPSSCLCPPATQRAVGKLLIRNLSKPKLE